MTYDSQQANISTLCPNNATCPFIADAGDGNYLVIGATTTPEHAAQHGGNVGDGETAVLVPKDVIDDAVAGPLRARIADLEAERVRLQSIHGHDFTNVHQQPITCICGVEYLQWLDARKSRSELT